MSKVYTACSSTLVALQHALSAIVAKTVSVARRNNDAVNAVIEGCVTGSDGAVDKVAFKVPSSAGRAQTVAAAVRDARASPRLVRYVELHGSWMSMGNTLELSGLERGLEKVKQPSAGAESIVHVGSDKGTFENTEAASGMLILIKIVLAVPRGSLPAVGVLGLSNRM